MISFLPVLAIMFIIFALSHTPGSQLPQSIGGFDKFFHTIAYTALGLTALVAVRKRFHKTPWSTGLYVILFCVIYGITDEFHQSFIPGRYPSVLDIIADTTGGILAVSAWSLWSKSKRDRTTMDFKQRTKLQEKIK